MRNGVLVVFLAASLYAQDAISQAIALARAHRYKEAAEAIASVPPPEGKTQSIAYHRLKAAIALGNGDAPSSATEMEAALALAPDDPKLAAAAAAAEYAAAEFQEQHGDSLAAVHAYEAAAAHAPEVEQYHLALGLELLRHHTFDAAAAVFANTVKRFPSSERARVALGISYYLQDRNAEAAQALMAAGPKSELAASYLGLIELERAEAPDGDAIGRVCGFAMPHLQALCGGLLLRDGNRQEALPHLSKAAKAAPEDRIARCELGKAYELARDWEKARPEMEACVRLDPGSPVGHYRLARTYHGLGLEKLAQEQQRLRTEAEQRLGAENERRYASVSGFLVK